MTDTTYINFTYTSPSNDLFRLLCYNPDETINLKCTLISVKELLAKNINVIDQLITGADNITDITPVRYGIVEIEMNNQDLVHKLLEQEILTTNPQIVN